MKTSAVMSVADRYLYFDSRGE